MIRLRMALLTAALLIAASTGMAGARLESTPDEVASGVKNVVRTDIPTLQFVEPKYYSFMKDSHLAYLQVGADAKMMPDDHERYLAMPERLDPPQSLWVWTHGEPSVYHSPPNVKVPTGEEIHGFKASLAELERLGAIAPVAWTSPVRPFASLVVDSKAQVDQVLSLPFVYLVETQAPAGPGWSAYQGDWIREQQKIHLAKSSRNGWDGTEDGKMPSIVWFHILDTGYDASESVWSQYGSARINSHGHDWTAANNGIGGSENNAHGTLVTDTLAFMNYFGGTFYVHQVGDPFSWDDIRQALEDIDLNHAGADVVTMSYALFYDDFNCHDDYDDILSNLMQTDNTLLSVFVGNPGQPLKVTYPGSSTWAFAVGGATSANPWGTPSGAKYGTVTMSSANCPLQYNYHSSRDGATTLFKPDVYGFYYVDTDTGGRWSGTSFATPEIASGLGTIESRFYLGKDSQFIPWKRWKASGSCWEGAVKLVHASNAPDGRGVSPTASSLRGDLADHDAWFQNGWTC